ncbi:hypothetical protein D8860_05960 [Streptococcus oralis]|uniref:Integrase catalytic domain-containing protein n=1 Tax=Streptococcus oralis TaxID=1303 RepID=A0A428BXV3_STROR|nr:hypothetical protein D8860_05960 [Streptococcus oralis]
MIKSLRLGCFIMKLSYEDKVQIYELRKQGYSLEMFYGYEKHFRSLEDLEQSIVDYIDYYNNKRIKVKLKGLSPVQYRTKSFT